jgi:hypothetical protein
MDPVPLISPFLPVLDPPRCIRLPLDRASEVLDATLADKGNEIHEIQILNMWTWELDMMLFEHSWNMRGFDYFGRKKKIIRDIQTS